MTVYDQILTATAVVCLILGGAAAMAAPATQSPNSTVQTQLEAHYNPSGPSSQRWR